MEEEYKLCPKCGFKMKEYYCMSCGYVDKEQYDKEHQKESIISTDTNKNLSHTKKDEKMLILSLVNMFGILPAIAPVLFIASLFLALGDIETVKTADTIYLILKIYVIFSIIFLLKSIWNMIRGNRKFRIIYMIILIILVLGFIFLWLNIKYHFI